MYGERDSKGFSLLPPITQEEEEGGGGSGVVKGCTCHWTGYGFYLLSIEREYNSTNVGGEFSSLKQGQAMVAHLYLQPSI